MAAVDLHLHSKCSDGTDSPTELVKKAASAGVGVTALTDHDTVIGVPEFLESESALHIKRIAGVEFSVENFEGLKDIDVLAYYPDNGVFMKRFDEIEGVCRKISEARIDRLRKISTILASDGIKIDPDEILSGAEGIVGRKHIAISVLKKNPGVFKTQQEIFDRYLADGCKADVPISFQFTLKSCADFIRSTGGYAFLAHPGVSNGKVPDIGKGLRLIKAALEAGMCGAEAYYLYHKNRPYTGDYAISEEENTAICGKYRSFISGLGGYYTAGSDYHGKNKDIKIGECANDGGEWPLSSD
ncbi:MAG: PHP domain-containing protein [Fibrobacterota bacterium]